ncbi:aminotransferase class IV, partial [Thermodesulfobacteriota bacterium]
VIERLADENGLDGEGCAKILVTRGGHTGDLALFRATEPSILVTVIPYRSVIPYRNPMEDGRRDGLRLLICDRPRQNENGSLWRHKSLNYLVYLQVRDEAARAGFDDGILLNQRGEVCESSVANIFALSGERVLTPAIDCGVLPGIVRAEIIKLLTGHGTPVTETHMSPQELLSADEIFLTNSLMEIAPVSAIDGNEGLGCSRTLEIKGLFEQYRDRDSII